MELLYFRSFALALFVGLAPTIASACVTFGADQPVIDKVQSSWGPAEDLIAWGDYTAAVERLEATSQYLRQIHDAFIRSCVAGGVNIRLASAKAGEAYFAAHPGDSGGAKRAANRAWKAFPLAHNCP